MVVAGEGIVAMVREIAAALLASLMFASGPANAQDGGKADVRVGDRWAYELKDAATGDLRHSATIVVVGVTDKEINTQISLSGRDKPMTYIYGRDWSRIQDTQWKFQPPEGGFRFPLKVGAEWRRETGARHLSNGTGLQGSSLDKVLGEEKVTTPAGTFDTYKVQRVLQQTGGDNRTRVSVTTATYWYAPAINRWVKRSNEVRSDGRVRDSTVEELTAYSRKP